MIKYNLQYLIMQLLTSSSIFSDSLAVVSSVKWIIAIVLIMALPVSDISSARLTSDSNT